ncbi:hypothetical protein HG536_0A08800 [Torulaspora globosa]|uniref:Uncharacterized protein n=1 Tax=Torulaspora globosa TaxID=48254 RepID=A0A7G3ZC27_9SACH|nr:uncharacterized protein HG536_0A08800 [Torulaspora globosa]QLL31063.1 hypothetical protein HG536_0A08800 [Torulaspora globosa]
MEGAETRWALNRPVSAHITVHYEDGNKESGEGFEPVAGNKVVKTVLNIEADEPGVLEPSGPSSRSSMGSLRRYSLREASREEPEEGYVSPASSRRASNANSLHISDFYQCVHRDNGEQGSPKTAGSNPVARRYSEPRLPHNHYSRHHFQVHQHRGSCVSTASGNSPILRSLSCAADMDPTIMRLPPLTKRRSPQAGEEGASLSPCSSSSSIADSYCLDLSCACTRHHHRRNSVAVKFNKALYKRA